MAEISAANLKTYLSGGAGNTDPAASIGGARSTTAWAGGTLNDLFRQITGAEAAAGVTLYRCIFIRNEDVNANGWQSVVAWISSNTDNATTAITIGLDLAGKNAAADTIAGETTAPDPAVTFSAAANKGAGLAVGTLAQNDYYGIWIKLVVTAATESDASDDSELSFEGDTVP
jgi:hypothetical protein